MNYTARNLAIAIALMVVGIVLTMSWSRQQKADLTRGQEHVTVLVAKQDIPAGTPAAELDEYVEETTFVRENEPPRAVDELKDLENLVSNEVVYQGEPITMRAFNKEAGLKPTASIKGNERIISIAIPSSADAAGAVRPGDHIDIFYCTGNGGGTLCPFAARDVLVRATPESLVPATEDAAPVEPQADGDRRLYQLQLTDQQAINVSFAQSVADKQGLRFFLRPSSGATQTSTPGVAGPDAAAIPGVKPAPQPTS